jgi:hypothetical protein
MRGGGDSSFSRARLLAVRALRSAGLWVVLSVSGVAALAAQTDADSLQAVTREKLEALLSTYPPAQAMRFHRSPKEPFNLAGSVTSGLTYASSLEIVIVITSKQTIAFRVYPHYYGGYINIRRVRNPSALMQKMLEHAYNDFFFWGVDDALDVFVGYNVTLESGFPEAAIRVVISSIPLQDDTLGELRRWIE